MFTKTSLKARLIIWGLAALSLVGVIMYQFSIRQYDVIFNNVLYEKAVYINRFYAMVIADALYKKDDIHLLLWIEQLMLDREVATVLIVDSEGDIRYSDDLRKVGEAVTDERVRESLRTGQGYLDKGKFQNSMVLVSPLLVSGHPRPIGAVRFDLIKNNAKRAKEEAKSRFIPMAIGLIIFALSLLWMAVQRWVLYPIGVIRHGIAQMAGQVMELHVPIWPDEFGDLVLEVKQTLEKFKSDIAFQEKQVKALAAQEMRVIEQAARLTIGRRRILLVDLENRLLADIDGGAMATHLPIAPGTHLLDLITDSGFSALLSQAMHGEGDMVKGTCIFQGQKKAVSLLAIPAEEATRVKTLIVLSDEQDLLA